MIQLVSTTATTATLHTPFSFVSPLPFAVAANGLTLTVLAPASMKSAKVAELQVKNTTLVLPPKASSPIDVLATLHAADGAQGANCPRPVRHSKGTHNEHITSVGRAPWRL